LLFLILFSCDSKNQQRDETTVIDTQSQSVAEPQITAPVPASKTDETPKPAGTVERSANQLENFRAIDYYQPGKSLREASLRNFVDRLGKPQSTVKDTDTLCPIGQLHFWNIQDQGYRIFALGDAYTPQRDLTASCRVYGIQLMDQAAESAYAGFLGIKLGEEANTVENKLKEYVKANPAFSYQKLKEESLIDRFLTEKQKYVYVLTDGKRYYHFAIGKKQKLNYILIASINIQAAC